MWAKGEAQVASAPEKCTCGSGGSGIENNDREAEPGEAVKLQGRRSKWNFGDGRRRGGSGLGSGRSMPANSFVDSGGDDGQPCRFTSAATSASPVSSRTKAPGTTSTTAHAPGNFVIDRLARPHTQTTTTTTTTGRSAVPCNQKARPQSSKLICYEWDPVYLRNLAQGQDLVRHYERSCQIKVGSNLFAPGSPPIYLQDSSS